MRPRLNGAGRSSGSKSGVRKAQRDDRLNKYGRIAKLALATSAVAAVAFLVSACSSSDTMFPAVHDMPAARTETTLTPDQVKQATDSLVSERERLITEAQAAGRQPVTATNAPVATGSVPQKKSAASAQPAAQ